MFDRNSAGLWLSETEICHPCFIWFDWGIKMIYFDMSYKHNLIDFFKIITLCFSLGYVQSMK